MVTSTFTSVSINDQHKPKTVRAGRLGVGDWFVFPPYGPDGICVVYDIVASHFTGTRKFIRFLKDGGQSRGGVDPDTKVIPLEKVNIQIVRRT